MSKLVNLRRRYVRRKRKSRIALVTCLAKGRIVGPLPAFMVIGAQRSGTTFLFSLLTQHPHVAAPLVKEVHFFDFHFSRGVDWYRAHFSPREIPALHSPEPATITGEASPDYLYFPAVPERVHAVLPNVKLIAILRNPVDRAYSQYQLSKRIGVEALPFEEALAAEPERLGQSGEQPHSRNVTLNIYHLHHSYLSRGRYAEQLRRWMDFFPRDQLLVLNAERLYSHTDSTLGDVARFLGLPSWNPAMRLERNEQSYSPMSPETRQRLEVYFSPHNQDLYRLLGESYGWERTPMPAETVAT